MCVCVCVCRVCGIPLCIFLCVLRILVLSSYLCLSPPSFLFLSPFYSTSKTYVQLAPLRLNVAFNRRSKQFEILTARFRRAWIFDATRRGGPFIAGRNRERYEYRMEITLPRRSSLALPPFFFLILPYCAWVLGYIAQQTEFHFPSLSPLAIPVAAADAAVPRHLAPLPLLSHLSRKDARNINF